MWIYTVDACSQLSKLISPNWIGARSYHNCHTTRLVLSFFLLFLCMCGTKYIFLYGEYQLLVLETLTQTVSFFILDTVHHIKKCGNDEIKYTKWL
jgi:hypothetical protein